MDPNSATGMLAIWITLIGHNAYIIHFTSHCHIVMSSDIITRIGGEYSTVISFEGERDHTHITFITVYCHNWFTLLVVFHLLLCLIYKLNFIVGVYK